MVNWLPDWQGAYVMADINTDAPELPPASRFWLPSPGRLLAAVFLACVVESGGWFGWGVYQRPSRMQQLQQLRAGVVTEPADPVWLHDLVARKLGAQ